MTQGELEGIPQPLIDQMNELEMRIMQDVVEKIRENGFSTASVDWEISRLHQLGESEENIKKWIQEALKATDEELEKIFSDKVYEEYYGNKRAYELNGAEQIHFEENKELQQMVGAIGKQTKDTFRNMTASLGFARLSPSGKIEYDTLQEFYSKTLDAAMLDIHSGSFDYNTVLNRTIDTMTKSGVRWVDYESGHHDRVDVAARRAVMTGFRQIQGKINEQVANDLGTDTYEVTWHGGARPTHQTWQGRVWTMNQLVEVCGLGDVTGLHGANCYHDYNAFFPGISIRTYTDEQLDEMNGRENEPKEYNGKEYTTYQALQQQRKMERAMRKTRQDINLMKHGDADSDDIMLKKAKYHGQMQTYKDFSEKMGLPEQMDRVYQDGLKGTFGSKAAFEKTKVEKENKRKVKQVAKHRNSDIMESDLGTFKEKLREDANMDRKYYSALKDKFSHGSNDAKAAFAKFVPKDSVEDAVFEGAARFNTKTKKICMHYGKDLRNERGAGTTWFHEHGHLIDDAAGKISDDKKFLDLLKKDSYQYRLEYGRKHKLETWDKVDSAISSELNDMKKHSGVSDMFEGITGGNVRGVAGHPEGYWSDDKNVTAEAFAHMFECEFDKERYMQMKRYFPESLKYFEEKLKEAVK